MEHIAHKESSTLTWIAVLLLVLWVFGKGFYAFWIVGDNGQPDWSFRPVLDTPAESSYAVYPLLPQPQHVLGADGEDTPFEVKYLLPYPQHVRESGGD